MNTYSINSQCVTVRAHCPIVVFYGLSGCCESSVVFTFSKLQSKRKEASRKRFDSVLVLRMTMMTRWLPLLKALAMHGPADEVMPVLIPWQCSSSSSLFVLVQLAYRLSRALLL
jgi:hypothetical protein